MTSGTDCGSLVSDATPSGVIVLDAGECVLFWNKWMARHSGIPGNRAQGRRLGELFPEIAGTRLEAAIRTALTHRLAGIVSPSIHAPPLPLFRQPTDQNGGERLAQLIHVTPLKLSDGKACALYIQDMTAAVQREQRLQEQARALAASNEALQAQIDEIRALQSRIEDLNARDPLTGVWNRERIEKAFEQVLVEAAERSESAIVAMFDIDMMKKINEAHGYGAGDALLKALADLLGETMPASAKIGRHDDDRFLVVVPAISLADALDLAEQVRRRFAELEVGYQDKRLTATLSAGLAAFPEHGKWSDELKQCLDLVMFLARHDGYDRVLAYGQTHHEI